MMPSPMRCADSRVPSADHRLSLRQLCQAASRLYRRIVGRMWQAPTGELAGGPNIQNDHVAMLGAFDEVLRVNLVRCVKLVVTLITAIKWMSALGWLAGKQNGPR